MKLETSILTIKCPDTTGIAAEVFTFIRDFGGFVTEASQYGDPTTKTFFMRIVFTAWVSSPSHNEFSKKFHSLSNRFKMDWQLVDGDKPLRVLIAVSKFGHCLNDLLHRYRTKGLFIEVPAVVSNHEDMRSLVEWHNIPYHYLPLNKEEGEAGKRKQEEKILKLVHDLDIDLVVLARYMQVLSPEMCEKLSGRCINIHHSFLPSFKGARPYHQAHARGVKIIGATAHYVTNQLDEGPIIEQAVERVDHTHTADALVSMGQDLENLVLSRALRYQSEHRILMNGNRTVVFK